ncbi:DUF5677 domain-containing protein [Sulfitobacter sp. TCYB15]|uniref:DUF5677 domain-containing protein n=1 Tax=Sulfitobacter sp. TCYB15 TaxID=3229275 RepID=A0AAU8C5Q8_9RHOB
MNDGTGGNNHPLLRAFEEIEKLTVSEDELAAFTNEDDFIGLGVSLLIEAGSYVCIAANTLGEHEKWDRDTAAIGGNLVRLYKMISAFLDQTVQRRRETSFIFARLVFETVVTIRYLIKYFSHELVASYVKNSFKHEIKLRTKIDQNIATRGGLILPIEDRMMKSIDRAFSSAGLSPEDFAGPTERNWGGKNLYEKASDLGMGDAYLAAFSGPSQSIHGAWGDIYSHCLQTEGNGLFSPKIEWGYPRPQLISALATLSIFAIDDYFGFVGGPELQEAVQEHLNDLAVRLHALDQAHENYLAPKEWPNV